jgi:hypothetical protein
VFGRERKRKEAVAVAEKRSDTFLSERMSG